MKATEIEMGKSRGEGPFLRAKQHERPHKRLLALIRWFGLNQERNRAGSGVGLTRGKAFTRRSKS